MSDTLFVKLMKAALEKHQAATTDDERRLAEQDMTRAIRLNYHGDLNEAYDPKMAAAGLDE